MSLPAVSLPVLGRIRRSTAFVLGLGLMLLPSMLLLNIGSGCSEDGGPALSAMPDTSALIWSSPVAASTALPMRARWPSLAIDSAGTVRIAVTTTPDTSHTPDEVVLLVRRDGAWELDAEVSQTPTVSRRAIARSFGNTTHVLWVEHDAAATDVPLGSSVWHRACTSDGCGPTSPLYRVAPDRMSSSRVMPPTMPLPSADDRLNTAIHVLDGKRSGLYIYGRSGNGWAPSHRFVNAAEPVLLPDPQGRRHLVSVADLNRGTTPDPNSLVVRTDTCTSSSAGPPKNASGHAPWCRPRVVYASNGVKAYAPAAAADTNRLHVAWLIDVPAGGSERNVFSGPTRSGKSPARGGTAQCIMHRTMLLSGTLSTDPATLLCPPARGRMYDVNTVVDDRDRLHLIATWQPYFAAPRGHLYHAIWDNGMWSALRRIPGIRHSAIEADVQYDGNHLHLAWTHIRGGTVEVRYATASTRMPTS